MKDKIDMIDSLTNTTSDLKKIIEKSYESITSMQTDADSEIKEAVEETFRLLGQGHLRVASKETNGWTVHTWLKKAILLHFRLQPMRRIAGAAEDNFWWDKIKPKFSNWQDEDFRQAGVRCVPHSFAREGSYIAPGAVLMPSFVNVGAYIDAHTMIDAWATVGSCAQIGKNVHISGGAGIGGVLEPLQANPVVIEDDCFIGARSEVAEGVIVEQGSVLSMGVYIGASTKIVDRQTGEIYYGKVPAFSVVVPGTLPGKMREDNSQEPSLYCAVIIKKADAKTRSKTSINALLRD